MTLTERKTSDRFQASPRSSRRAADGDRDIFRALARAAGWTHTARWYFVAVALVGFVSLAVMYGVYRAQATQLKAGGLKAGAPATDPARTTSPTPAPTPTPTPSPTPSSEPSTTTGSQAEAAPDLTAMVWPVTGTVTTPYGWAYSKTMQDWRLHQAVDLKADDGAPVRAALSGTVVSAGKDPNLGYLVILDHGGGVRTAYGGLKGAEVNPGDRLEQGDYLGKVGTSALAESADGPHLHFALTVKDNPTDPRNYLK